MEILRAEYTIPDHRAFSHTENCCFVSFVCAEINAIHLIRFLQTNQKFHEKRDLHLAIICILFIHIEK